MLRPWDERRPPRRSLFAAGLSLLFLFFAAGSPQLENERWLQLGGVCAQATTAPMKEAPAKEAAMASTHDEEELGERKKVSFRSYTTAGNRRRKKYRRMARVAALAVGVATISAVLACLSRAEKPTESVVEKLEKQKAEEEAEKKLSEAKKDEKQEKSRIEQFQRQFIDTVKEPALKIRHNLDSTLFRVGRQLRNIRKQPKHEAQMLLVKLHMASQDRVQRVISAIKGISFYQALLIIGVLMVLNELRHYEAPSLDEFWQSLNL